MNGPTTILPPSPFQAEPPDGIPMSPDYRAIGTNRDRLGEAGVRVVEVWLSQPKVRDHVHVPAVGLSPAKLKVATSSNHGPVVGAKDRAGNQHRNGS